MFSVLLSYQIGIKRENRTPVVMDIKIFLIGFFHVSIERPTHILTFEIIQSRFTVADIHLHPVISTQIVFQSW